MSQALDQGARRWTVLTAVTAVLPIGLELPPSIQGLLLVCFGVGSASALSGRMLPRPLRAVLSLLVLIGVLWAFEIGSVRTFGRDAGSALLAAMLGMKLLETATLRDARSSVVFGLFAIMAAFLQDQGPTTLLLSLAAGLFSIATLDRLSQMESPDGDSQGLDDLPWSGRLRIAGWLLAVSLPLAAVGFLLFPRLAQPLWGLPQNSDAGRTGLSEDMSPGDIANLFVDDTPVARVTFEGDIPPPAQRYFRGPVLDQFDGRRWTRGYIANNRAGELEPLGDALAYTVEQEPTDRQYLFALDLPVNRPDGARHDHGRALRVPRPLSRLRRERYESVVRYRLETNLPRTLQRAFTRLPEDFNPRSVALARQWRQQHGSPEGVIQAALELFNAEFTYTLEAPLLGRDSVDDFLFESRRGYCEHFSSAFTVLMRAAGIPARVVTGYQGGNINPIGPYLLLRQSDAHAWSEVWIEGRGWLRVDPTNAVSPERIEQGIQSLREETVWGEASEPLRNAVDWLRRGWNDWVLGYGALQQQQLLRPFGVEKADWRQLGMALLVAAGVALGVTVLILLRRPADGQHPVERAWNRLRSRLRRAGHAVPQTLPPRALAEDLYALPDIQQLCRRYSDWAYAPPASRGDDGTLLRDLRRARVPKRG